MDRDGGSGAAAAAREFVDKSSRVQLPERAASHEPFLDLCRLLNRPTPTSADATGQDYCFERHAKVVRPASRGPKGGRGFVDVWWRGRFAWEYKAKDPEEAYRQLYQYRDDPDNPPLSVVCDIRNTEIRISVPAVFGTDFPACET